MGSLVFSREPHWISVPFSESSYTKGESRNPSLSQDGRFIAFQSKTALTPDDTNKFWDIYLFDRKEGRLKRINFPETEYANGGPFISATGGFLGFHSYVASVVRGRPPRTSDIFTYDVVRDKLSLLTKISDSESQDGENLYPILNQDGKYVVFSSNATNLTGENKKGVRNIILYSQKDRKLELISKTESGEPSNRPNIQPLISLDGRFVVFKSAATNLRKGLKEESLSNHLYRWDRKKKRLDWIDKPKYGFNPETTRIGKFVMDARGRTLVFEGFFKDSLSVSDLFMFNLKSRKLVALTKDRFLGKAHSPTLSHDARYLAFVFRGYDDQNDSGGIIVFDLKRDQFQKILDGSCENPTLSGDGTILAFESTHPKWRGSEKGKQRHVYWVKNPFEL